MDGARSNPTAAPGDASRPAGAEPHLFRFGLRQLFWWVSGVTVFVALLALVDGPWPWVIGSLAALIAAHVAGNSIGSRLRDTSAEVQRWRSAQVSSRGDSPAATPQPVQWTSVELPEATPLRYHAPAPRRRVHGATLAGALAGAGLGVAALRMFAADQATPAGLAAGAASCAVMGAWVAMLLTSFVHIARHAWRHAHGKR